MQVDETAVKSESKKGVTSPDTDDTGKDRRTAPRMIIIKNPAINIADGLNFLKKFFNTQVPPFKEYI